MYGLTPVVGSNLREQFRSIWRKQRGGEAAVIQLTMCTNPRQFVCRHLYRTDWMRIIRMEYRYTFNCGPHFMDES